MAHGPLGLPHIILPDLSQREDFKPTRLGRGGGVPSRVPDREAHAQHLLEQNRVTVNTAVENIAQRANLVAPDQNGFYLRVASLPAEPLLAEKFEQKRNKGVELLSVNEDPESRITTAALFVPAQSSLFLEETIEKYRTQLEPRAREPKPKHRDLVEGIGEISLAGLRDLWTDSISTFPRPGEFIHWEVWFRSGTTERFRMVALDHGLSVGAYPLVFPEDIALLVEGTPEQLAIVVDATVSVSRLGRAKRNSAFIVAAPIREQLAQVDAIERRLNVPNRPINSLCILDTGSNRAHPLLSRLLSQDDCHAYDPNWETDDHDGHGTRMAGISAYGDLGDHIGTEIPITIPYGLESVKIFPPVGQNPHDLLGAITAGGIARAERAAPHRKRVFCLASSTDEDTPHRGRPTSWSAELDQLCSGAGEESRVRRLICVSAGNIRNQLDHDDYLTTNDSAEIESPAQAWNAISVAAHTQKVEISSAGYEGWLPFATAGDLSPSSRTATWNRTWPIKPDIVVEGGNLGVDPADRKGYGIADLELLTTSKDYPNPVFETLSETSAATAGAARLAALIQNAYPELWPETIRGLMISSAEWTTAMLEHLPSEPTKTDHLLLLNRYGYGVPDFQRAIRSLRNDLTLVEQSIIKPYSKIASHSPKLNEMKIFSLPWPIQVLNDLGNEEVRMRVTLSYFIEPNPAESARNRKSRYASHGLRFAVKVADEDINEFRKRINKAARAEGETSEHASDTGWILGPTIRDRGSLHSDMWRGPASDLARRGVIAVFPVGGWWKERFHLGRYDSTARFALLVTIATTTVDLDIYTAVMNQIAVPIQL